VTARDIQVATWVDAIQCADQEMRARGVPVGSGHGPVSEGCRAVKRALEERLIALTKEPSHDL
jgi:hypothetical protein